MSSLAEKASQKALNLPGTFCLNLWKLMGIRDDAVGVHVHETCRHFLGRRLNSILFINEHPINSKNVTDQILALKESN